MIELPPMWGHQERGLTGVQGAIARKLRRILLTSPTGGGKTRILQELLCDWLNQGLDTVIYTNRNLLREQMSGVLESWGIAHGIRAAGEVAELHHKVQISSVQTEAIRVFGTAKKKPVWDIHKAHMVVTDECFVAETEILGSCGPVRIDNVKPGDIVHTAYGLGVVEVVSCRPAKETVKLEYDNGFSIECTASHPVFTGVGWVEAGSLEVGSFAYSPENVLGLWSGFWSQYVDQPGRVQGSSERESLEPADILLKILLEEVKQPNEQAGKCPKGQQGVEKDRSQADLQRRQRAAFELASACDLARSWKPVGGGVCNSNPNSNGSRVSDGLQGRHRKPGSENSHRDRRGVAQLAKSKVDRLKENSSPGRPRLVGVSRVKREGTIPVFNLQVSGHPSYFAGGVLVHNCHMNQGARLAKLKAMHAEAGATFVDITATPLDLESDYDELIQAGVVSELRECGALLPAVHHAIDEPDRKKVKPNPAGEYEVEPGVYRTIWLHAIVGRVIEKWRELNPDQRPTILFAPGVKEAIWFAEQFHAAGIRWASIDGQHCWVDGELHRNTKTNPVRQQILDDVRSGRIKGVANRFVLREGIDLPELYHGIFATVFGSLQSYLQSGGRLLRNPRDGSMERVIIQDHGGNWWRHGSLNQDRWWALGQDSRIEAVLREDRIRPGPNGEPPQERLPVLCPQCGALRMAGPSCTACGADVQGRRSRMVIQESGELREVGGLPLPARRIKMEPDTAKIWEKIYWRARRSKNRMTFRQAEALFVRENGYWPPRDLPHQPLRNEDWFQHVADVPAKDLR